MRPTRPTIDLDIVMGKAKDGDTDCQMSLGIAYAFGDGGLRQDDRLSLSWFHEAANGGRSDAMFALCDCYLYGLGTGADFITAAKWYSQGTERSNIEDPSLIRSPNIDARYVTTLIPLLEILGRVPMTRLEADRCVWRYFVSHRYLDLTNPRIICARSDTLLRCLFLGSETKRIFDFRGLMDCFMKEVPPESDGSEIIEEALEEARNPAPFVPFEFGDLHLKPGTAPRTPPEVQQPDPARPAD